VVRGTGRYGNVATRNLAVLKFLSGVGTWENPNKIRLGSGGFNPADITKILNDFLVRKYVTSRPSPVKKEWTEYRITKLGTETSKAFEAFLEMPGRKHMLGYMEDDEE
jgi:DNA-binding HxlR family transcriptional regulator